MASLTVRWCRAAAGIVGREEMHFLEPEQVNELANAIDDRYRALIYRRLRRLRAGELVGAYT